MVTEGAATLTGEAPLPRPAALDPLSRPIYVLLGFALVAELAVIAVSDFYIGSAAMLWPFTQMCLLAIIGWFSRRNGFPRIATFIEAVAIPSIAGALAVIATVLFAAICVPFVDGSLDVADEALGFDFLWLARYYEANPDLARASRYAYLTFAIQSAALPGLVALSGAHRRLWIMLNAWVFALALAVLIFPFAPAAGPFVFHGIEENVFDQWRRLFPYQTGPAIEALRDGSMRDVTAAARGLVSIPSFHAVAGVIFAWVTWPSKWLRWPMIAINLALIASTIVTGSHYLIDVIAGIVLAVVAIQLATRWADHIDGRSR